MKTLRALVELIVLLADPVIRLITVLRGDREEARIGEEVREVKGVKEVKEVRDDSTEGKEDEDDNDDCGALHGYEA